MTTQNLEGIIDKRWKIIRPLANQGATKKVFLAEDLIFGDITNSGLVGEKWLKRSKVEQYGVLKIKLDNEDLPAQAREALLSQREIGVLQSLQGANLFLEGIVRIKGVGYIEDKEGKASNKLYHVEELVEGTTLADSSFQKNTIRTIAAGRDIAYALSQIHNLEIGDEKEALIHGDVKPANILIDGATGRAKLSDFGSARFSSGEPSVLSSILYCAPEAFRRQDGATGRVEPASDVYSLAASLYHVLTGEPLFTSTRQNWQELARTEVREERNEVELKHKTAVPLNPSTKNPEIPESVAQGLLDALNKDPSKRPSAEEFYKQLGGGLNEKLWWFRVNEPPQRKDLGDKRKTNNRELLRILGEERILPLLNKVKGNNTPFIIYNGQTEWSMQSCGYWSGGRFLGSALHLFEETGNQLYLDPVLERTQPFFDKYPSKGDMGSISDTSLGLADSSHQLFSPLARMTGKAEFKDFVRNALRDFKDKFYDPRRKFIRTTIEEEAKNRLTAGCLGIVVPFLIENGETQTALDYAETSIRCLVREEGSVREFWELSDDGLGGYEFDKRGYRSLEKDRRGSHLAQDQAYEAFGLSRLYEHTREPFLLETAERILDYTNRFRTDRARNNILDIAPWDYEDEGTSRTDSFATTIEILACLALARSHPDVRKREAYKARAFRDQDALISKYLVLDKNYQGMLRGAFRAVEETRETDCCLFFADYNFMKGLTESYKL